MKKITLITAAIAALAAATVAAQTGDHVTSSTQPDMVMASLKVEDAALRGAAPGNTPIRDAAASDQIRYVIGPEPRDNSCDKAAWPYYPVDCLQPVEQSGL
ncbi:hypothetical protein [Hoeflea ulvae]|uniref:Uncharacterized protein n=1 Tax=Hoeflea ulvae TaxID=2983764 RepID=A0ABT3YE76_9HYPH|nr:hypothetical protein [Hoeflea ulvae]MCY0093977.1 hypothetical protein [Hoeflea ulvae]